LIPVKSKLLRIWNTMLHHLFIVNIGEEVIDIITVKDIITDDPDELKVVNQNEQITIITNL